MAWVSLCTIDELKPGQGKYVEIDGFRLAVFLDGEKISVIDSGCPHAGANLADGAVENGCVICPRHAWLFRLDNGEMPGSPGVAVTSYPVRLHRFDEKQFVQVEVPIF